MEQYPFLSLHLRIKKTNKVSGSDLDSEIGLVGKDSLVLAIANDSLTSEKINSLASEENLSSLAGTSVSVIPLMASSEASTSISSTSLSESLLTEPSPIQLNQQEEELKKLAQDIYTYIDQAKALEDGKKTVSFGKRGLGGYSLSIGESFS